VYYLGTYGSLVVSVLHSRRNGPGLSPHQGHCVMFLGNSLSSHSASLHPGITMGTSKFIAGGNPVMDWCSIQGGVEILLMLQKTEINAGLRDHLACVQTYSTLLNKLKKACLGFVLL